MDDPPYSAGLKFVDPPHLGSRKNIINGFELPSIKSCMSLLQGKQNKLSLIQNYLLIDIKGKICGVAAEIF